MRGGARKGAGAKPRNGSEKRVRICCTVDPQTARKLATLKVLGVSPGQIIDEAVKEM